MAALTQTNPEVYSGPPMQVNSDYYVKNGQSWKAGEFLYVDTNGQLVVCATDATVIKFQAIADQSDPGDSTTVATVGVIDADHIFRGNEYDTTATKAALGQKAAINVTDNVVSIDISDTTHDAVLITGIASDDNPIQDSNADTKARLYFKILDAALQGDPA